MDGVGYQTMNGVGPLSITDAGISMITLAGCGFQDTNGHHLGLPGDTMEIITAGRLLDLMATFMAPDGMHLQHGGPLFPDATSAHTTGTTTSTTIVYK